MGVVVWDSVMRTAVATDGRECKIYRTRSVVKLRLWAFVRREELAARSASPQSYACVFFLFRRYVFPWKHFILYLESASDEHSLCSTSKPLRCQKNGDLTNDTFWTILPLRVYMLCYIHSSHSFSYSYSLPKAVTYNTNCIRAAHL